MSGFKAGEYDDPAHYLEEGLGFKVERFGNGEVKVRVGAVDDKEEYIVVDIDDIPAIVGDTYRANMDRDDVEDKYVKERIVEGLYTNLTTVTALLI